MTAFHESPSTGPAATLAARIQAVVPVLETGRLTLRAPRIEDFSTFADMIKGPRGRYYGTSDCRKDAWRDFMQITGTWFLRGHGAWTVTKRETGEVLGFVHIGAEPGDMEPELGYVISADAEGRGIAFEAAQAVRDHALGALALPSLVSYVHPPNTRSAALAQRLGGTRDAVAEDALPEDDKALVFRHAPTGGPPA